MALCLLVPFVPFVPLVPLSGSGSKRKGNLPSWPGCCAYSIFFLYAICSVIHVVDSWCYEAIVLHPWVSTASGRSVYRTSFNCLVDYPLKFTEILVIWQKRKSFGIDPEFGLPSIQTIVRETFDRKTLVTFAFWPRFFLSLDTLIRCKLQLWTPWPHEDYVSYGHIPCGEVSDIGNRGVAHWIFFCWS